MNIKKMEPHRHIEHSRNTHIEAVLCENLCALCVYVVKKNKVNHSQTTDHLENLYKTKSLQDETLYNYLHTKIDTLGKKINLFIQGVERTSWIKNSEKIVSNEQPTTSNQ